MNIVCKLNNVIQANEKAIFTPEGQILKGQQEETWESWKVGKE